MKLQFTKMHSLGNDFIVIDDRELKLKNLPKLAKKLCDRRFGIGADQILLLCNSRKADFTMRIFNADGSEVEMCGNGIRCLGKYIWDREVKSHKSKVKKNSLVTQDLSIETLAGIKRLRKNGNLVEVDMGEPILEAEKIPVKIKQGTSCKKQVVPVINYPLKIKDQLFKITCVSMGNPHVVIIVKEVRHVLLDQYGPLIEHHKLFPKRTNVEFVQIMNNSNIKMRVWERGAGETMACGTGASASAVASVLLSLTNRKVTVHLPGGKLRIHWSEKDNRVYMTGDAVKVFEGAVVIPAKAGIQNKRLDSASSAE